MNFWWCKCTPNRMIPEGEESLQSTMRSGFLTRRVHCELCDSVMFFGSQANNMQNTRWEIWGQEEGDTKPELIYSFTEEEADIVEDTAAQLRARGVKNVTVKEVK